VEHVGVAVDRQQAGLWGGFNWLIISSFTVSCEGCSEYSSFVTV
jgi:hypothetical protein